MFEFLFKGGKTMVPLFICSFVALTIIIERFFSLQKKKIVPPLLGRAIAEKKGVADIYTESEKTPSALSRIIHNVYEVRKQGATIVQRVLQTSFKKEVVALERGLGGLEVIATITPLLGLLVTVLGMVDVFNVVAKIGVGQASAFASGIAKAMVTTIVGLSIAIPTLVFHTYFTKRAEAYGLLLEENSQVFVDRLN